MAFAGLAEVIVNLKIGPGLYLMRVQARELARLCQPGQFVHVRCSDATDPLLRRPISLHGIDYSQGTVSLLYQVVGRGTQLLAEMKPGQEIDLMGPLGRGFSIPDKVKDVLVIGGGIGAAPLFPLVQALKQSGVEQTVLLGARSANLVIGKDQLASLGDRVDVATDDGTMGSRGFVTELVENLMKKAKPDYFFACGPTPMLKQLLKLTRQYGVDGQVSLEEYMGCGVGACLACVCKIVARGQWPVASGPEAGGQGPGAGGQGVRSQESGVGSVGVDFEYKKVCVDGPVFEASEVMLDD